MRAGQPFAEAPVGGPTESVAGRGPANMCRGAGRALAAVHEGGWRRAWTGRFAARQTKVSHLPTLAAARPVDDRAGPQHRELPLGLPPAATRRPCRGTGCGTSAAAAAGLPRPVFDLLAALAQCLWAMAQVMGAAGRPRWPRRIGAASRGTRRGRRGRRGGPRCGVRAGRATGRGGATGRGRVRPAALRLPEVDDPGRFEGGSGRAAPSRYVTRLLGKFTRAHGR